MVAVRGDLDEIRTGRTSQLPQRLAPAASGRCEGLAYPSATRVHQEPLAGLGVLELEQPDRWQFLLARVRNPDGDEVVMAGRALERVLETLVEKIAEQE